MLGPCLAGFAMDTAGSPKKLAGRYEVREILGQGGMGLVYRAYDTVVRREVAVKTILDIPDPASLAAVLQGMRCARLDEPSEHRRDLRHRRV